MPPQQPQREYFRVEEEPDDPNYVNKPSQWKFEHG